MVLAHVAMLTAATPVISGGSSRTVWAKDGPAPHCWTGSNFYRSFKKCCNSVHGENGNPLCWDAVTPNVNHGHCCQGQAYTAQTCEQYVAEFDLSTYISGSRLGARSWSSCLTRMIQDPSACEAMGPQIHRYVTCIHSLRTADSRNRSRWVSVRGDDYPTMFVDQPDGSRWVVPAFDLFVGSRLLMDSRWSFKELDMLAEFLNPGDIVVDAGANLGGFAVPLARIVGRSGSVHAFEPFRHIFQLLTANVALNGLSNVFTYHRALGDEEVDTERPSPDLQKMGNAAKMHVVSDSPRLLVSYSGSERVHVRPLDSFGLAPRLIKIDVEGMELKVLRGAMHTLVTHRPLLFIEDSEMEDLVGGRLDGERLTSVMKLLDPLGYICLSTQDILSSNLCAYQSEAGAALKKIHRMRGF